MAETPPPANEVDITVKKFEKHMVTDDYKITLKSPTDTVDCLIKKVLELKKEIETK